MLIKLMWKFVNAVQTLRGPLDEISIPCFGNLAAIVYNRTSQALELRGSPGGFTGINAPQTNSSFKAL